MSQIDIFTPFRRSILGLIQVFLVGLLIHFFLYTFVTYKLGIGISAIWAWKELVIIALSGIAGWGIRTYKLLPKLWSSVARKRFFGAFVLGIGGSLIIHLFNGDASISRWILGMRYDYLGFGLLLIGWIVASSLKEETNEHLFRRYARVMKRCLVIALIWRCLVAIKPGTLKLFGYNNYVFEGMVGAQPPAVYYTHINRGIPRSQFLFERPTTRGFWLTAFFPLFFITFLRRRRRQDTRGWWAIYGLNIVLTFSRAAWGAWIIVILCTIAVFSTISRRRLLLRYGIPLLGLFGILLIVGREQIMSRGYSNYGHMTMIKKGLEMLLQKPFFGRGGASVGPGSHRGGLAFNPENQFLQVVIEFGVLGALPWLFLWGRSLWIGIKLRIVNLPTLSEDSAKSVRTVIAFSLGLLSLTISGMVLHTFGDRMVVYPFMLLFGCAIGRWRKNSLLHLGR